MIISGVMAECSVCGRKEFIESEHPNRGWVRWRCQVIGVEGYRSHLDLCPECSKVHDDMVMGMVNNERLRRGEQMVEYK